jgi:hypothetical protein
MIDLVLRLGFGKRTLFSGRIFLPSLGQNQSTVTEKRTMEFVRTEIDDLPLPDMETLKEWPPVPLLYTEKDSFLLRLETPATVEEAKA